MLAQVVDAAAGTTSVTLPQVLQELVPDARAKLKWGVQREVVALDHQTCTKAAGYIAGMAKVEPLADRLHHELAGRVRGSAVPR